MNCYLLSAMRSPKNLKNRKVILKNVNIGRFSEERIQGWLVYTLDITSDWRDASVPSENGMKIDNSS